MRVWVKWVLVSVPVIALLINVILGAYQVGHNDGVASVPTATITSTPTETATPTGAFTPVPTYTPYPTSTHVPTYTPQPTYVPGPDPEAEFLLGMDMMCQYANYIVKSATNGAWAVGDCRIIIQAVEDKDWYGRKDLRKTATPKPNKPIMTPTFEIGTLG